MEKYWRFWTTVMLICFCVSSPCSSNVTLQNLHSNSVVWICKYANYALSFSLACWQNRKLLHSLKLNIKLSTLANINPNYSRHCSLKDVELKLILPGINYCYYTVKGNLEISANLLCVHCPYSHLASQAVISENCL